MLQVLRIENGVISGFVQPCSGSKESIQRSEHIKIDLRCLNNQILLGLQKLQIVLKEAVYRRIG
jgi:hypothetical protein